MGEISIIKLLVVVVLIILVFGIKKLCMLGGDLGLVIKGFKKVMNEDDDSVKKIIVEEEVLVQKFFYKE